MNMGQLNTAIVSRWLHAYRENSLIFLPPWVRHNLSRYDAIFFVSI